MHAEVTTTATRSTTTTTAGSVVSKFAAGDNATATANVVSNFNMITSVAHT